MLGFELDFWDYVTFGAFFLMAAASVLVLVFLGGLPGRIAIARKHPEAEAVKVMGWVGLFFAFPWIQAFGWAFKPTSVVDIRYFPREEQRHIEEENANLQGKEEKDRKTHPSRSRAEHPDAPTEA
jgi:hypothetical protein